jgi:hypothetical protein
MLQSVIARSVSDEAIQSALAARSYLDCFASLAMTMEKYRAASHPTPSFFCRLDDEVVYWNTSRLSG